MSSPPTASRHPLGGLALLAALGLSSGAAAQCEVLTLHSPASSAFESYGTSVAVEGEWLAIGAYRDEGPPGPTNPGAVYMYRRDDAGTPIDPTDDAWSLETRLDYPSLPTTGAWFGYDVDLDGDRLLVGAPEAWGPIDPTQGAAYVFRLEGGAWQLEATLFDADGLSSNFGHSVAISGGQALVGAPYDVTGQNQAGSASIFRLDDAGTPGEPSDDAWVLQAKLVDTVIQTFVHFGWSVALDGDRAAIGAKEENTNMGADAGAVYVFERGDNGTPEPADDLWIQRAHLQPDDGGIFGQFGNAVALDGDTLLAGRRHVQGAGLQSGAAYVFRHDDGGTPGVPGDDTWPQLAKLSPSPPHDNDEFGEFVALDGDAALVSSRRHAEGTDDGTVHAFREVAGAWTAAGEMTVATGKITGVPVALDGQDAVGGALSDESSPGAADGTTHVYAIERAPWTWLGHELPGATGAPCLFGAGPLTDGEPYSIAVRHGVPLSLAVLILGATAIEAPFKGGVLVPSPDRLYYIALDAQGELAAHAIWPAGVPATLALYLQAWIVDPSGPAGFSATNALTFAAP